jgi:cellulose synthase/poly-beta-1,6-N-acetylglucosamine synthase-like glycosyltransferase
VVFVNFSLWRGLGNTFRKPLQSAFLTSSEKTAVVISARNEACNLPHIINALRKQDAKNFNVTVIDDYSSDNSFDEAVSALKELPDYKVIRNSSKQGKKYSLTEGIESSSGELILITDADCIPQEKWIESFHSRFSEGFDLLFGIAPLYTNNKFVTKLAAFENLRSFLLSFAAAGSGLPYSAAARSLGFRRSAFERFNGYKNTMEIPFGDDGLLIREAVKHNMRIDTVTAGEGSFVYSVPKQTFKEYLKQRKRHTTTSFYYSKKVKSMLAVWHLVNLIPLFLFLFTPLNILLAVPLAIKLTADAIIILVYQKRFGYSFKLYKIIYVQLIYEIMAIINFFNALTGKVNWK